MCLFHDATPTWSGFNYQGKLALFHALKMMNSVQESDYEKYELELEWFEDFAIKKDCLYKTIHQVKAYNTDSISKYNDAIWGLAKRLLKNTDLQNAYLHTWKNIDCDWEKSVKEIVENNLKNGDPNTNIIQNKLSNDEEFEMFYKQMCAVKRGAKSNLEKFIHELLGDDYKNLDEYTFKTELHNKIRTYKGAVEEYETIYESNKNIIDKIIQYDYSGKKYCDLNNVSSIIKTEIKNYFTSKEKYVEAKDDNHVENIYMHLLGLIDRYVMNRHDEYDSKKQTKVTIEFKKLEYILSRDIDSSEVFYLYKLKEQIYNNSIQRCKRCKDLTCTKCNVKRTVNYISSMDTEKFKKFCIVSSPSVVIGDRISADEFKSLIPEQGLESYFYALKNIENGWEYDKYIYHDKDKLLTTLTNNLIYDLDEGEVITVENILENDKIHEILMEHSVIVSNNIDIDDIGKINSNINKISYEDLDILEEEKDYDINDINKIQIKSVKKYMEEVNDKNN